VLRQRRAIDPEIKKMWRLAASTGAVGIEIAVAIALPTLLGRYLDGKYGTKWIIYVGLVIGVGAAIKALARVAREYKRASGDSGDSGPGKN
jgi:F0F1-type ATP synthase assembly protein I